MGKFKIIMIGLTVFSIWGCGLSIVPSKTTVTYGESETENDTAKDAKNDSTTTSDSHKKSWTIKQEFKWGREK
tara:strand:- start:122 stop:340 length:219 start_codon:yes stop_codon:yes gene_type:complete